MWALFLFQHHLPAIPPLTTLLQAERCTSLLVSSVFFVFVLFNLNFHLRFLHRKTKQKQQQVARRERAPTQRRELQCYTSQLQEQKDAVKRWLTSGDHWEPNIQRPHILSVSSSLLLLASLLLLHILKARNLTPCEVTKGSGICPRPSPSLYPVVNLGKLQWSIRVFIYFHVLPANRGSTCCFLRDCWLDAAVNHVWTRTSLTWSLCWYRMCPGLGGFRPFYTPNSDWLSGF